MSARARVCPSTGLYVVPARGEDAWRVAKEAYVRSGGILAVRRNKHIGPLPEGVVDSRGRFDTIGSTVYFGRSPEVAFAEVLQDFRRKRLALQADADATGLDVDAYVAEVEEQAGANGVEAPWSIPVDWQMSRCLHRVAMPNTGWWVRVDEHATINRVNLELADQLSSLDVPLLSLGEIAGQDRAVTTIVAQYVRSQVLFDGSLPLGIEFPSKTGYGRCLAWWNRRGDDGLTPGADDPKTLEDLNVDGRPFRRVVGDLELKVSTPEGR